MLKSIRRKLNSLDEKVMPTRLRGRKAGRVIGVVAGAVIGLAGICGALKYNNWRNSYSYRETEHISAPRYLNVSSDSHANKLLADFPVEITGADRVDKYVTPGARYCLVHVRQRHLSEDISQERLKRVELVQGNIYEILSSLIKNQGLKEVYDEGLTPEFESWIASGLDMQRVSDSVNKSLETNEKRVRERSSELEEKIKVGKKSVSVALEADIKYPNDRNSIDKYLSDLCQELEEQRKKLPQAIKEDNEKEQEKKNKYLYEAVKKVAVEYGTKIIAAETLEGNVRGSLAMDEIKKGNKDPKLTKIIYDDREDILLDAVAKQECSLAVCVYGISHAWGDNIIEWNEKHPDKKFSLIEITPKHYDKK